MNAERAYAGLARELVPPRGTIDLVVADNTDYVNGYATPFPTNRIVVFAHPSSDEAALRNYSDWNELVITHELTHIFHLDRVRGIWSAGQKVFGRNPILFPNSYQPSWVTEGLAVYYESRLTGAGRLESGSHFMAARAAALAREVPHLAQLTRETSRFPGGSVVYIYGSLLFDYLSRTTGPGNVRKFIEKSSGSLIPFFGNANAKSAFGITFETAWRRWRDSLIAGLPPRMDPPGWRDLTLSGRAAVSPRWISDSVILYAGSKGKEVPALYSVTLAGREHNLGRRNGIGANATAADGVIFFTQPDLTSPYEERTDLWMQRGRRQSRLTRGARLHSLDVRADGEVVAVQNIPASTRLVRVSRDGKSIATIGEGSISVQWADPRWSPDGRRVAAARLTAGRSEIVILDSAGKEMATVAGARAITASPSWSPDGRHLYFSSERTGSSQLFVASLDGPTMQISRLTSVATGIFQPDISPDGRSIAATLYRADGYHIGVFPVPEFAALPRADSVLVSPRSLCTDCISTLTRVAPETAPEMLPVTPYSAFPTILPHYWLPVFQSSADNGSGFGLQTSDSDLIGRHAYDVELLHNTTHGENSGWLYYQYAGLGAPLVGFSASQSYSRTGVSKISGVDTIPVGDFVQRSRLVSVQSVFTRPRVRTYAALAIGAELERKANRFDLDTVLPGLPTRFRKELSYPAVYLNANWSNAQHPALSISAEDGISFSTTVRQRWRTGDRGFSSRSAVSALRGFKSLDLPGFAHHVLAVRFVGGIADHYAPDRFSAGGVSGGSLALISGYGVGGQRRPFGVRGYPVSAEQGIRAMAGTLEYRAPLFAPSRGFRFFPLFIDKVSAVAFGDAGRAYCPAAAASGTVCKPGDVGNPWMSSWGAEINVDTGIQLDFPARLRLGVAIPTAHRHELKARSALVYATFGSAF